MRSSLPKKLSAPRSTSTPGGVNNARSTQQQVACDRCRGQKLRCIRAIARGTCNRCQKAGATCVTDPTIRMGRRPRNVDKSNSKDGASQVHQRTRGTSSPSSYKVSSYPVSEGSNTNADAWTESDPAEETVDPTLKAMPYSEYMDFGISGLAFDGMSLPMSSEPSDYLDGTVDLIPTHTAPSFPHFGVDGLQQNSMQNSGKVSNKEPLASHDPIIEMFEQRDIVDMLSRPMPSSPQEPIAKVSNLNLELHQQLAIVSELVKEYRNTDPGLLKQNTQETAIVSSIAFMLRGLQTFHDLMLHVLGPRDDKAPTGTTEHGSSDDKGQARPWRQGMEFPGSPNHAEAGDMTTDNSVFAPWTVQLPPGSVSSDLPLHDNSSELAFLDVSSSLLVISCYINLIRFCHAVFICIRGTLDLGCQQTSLSTMSGLEFSGVSIPQDPHLQIVVLIQVVIRLIDSIGLALRHPHHSAATREKRKRYDKAIAPHLLDFLLKQEGMAEHPACEGGTKVLREEMRKLNEVVYKSV